MLQTDKKKKKGFSDFDADLKFGKEHEEKAKAMLFDQRSTFEFKTERNYWYKTGNMAVEVECNGVGSGITTTKAKYWVQVYADGDEDCAYLIIPTKRLRKIKDKYVHKKKSVGDGKRAKTILIPNSEILLAKNLIQK